MIAAQPIVETGFPHIDTVVRRIVETSSPVGVLLFGSYARGEQRPDSDMDLLVVVPDEIVQKRAHGAMLRRSVSGVPMSMDLVVVRRSELERWRNVKGLVYREAVNEGKVLFGVV